MADQLPIGDGLPPGSYIDEDTTDAFLDLPMPKYAGGPLSSDRNRLDPEWRKAHGLGPLRPLSVPDPDR